jgi:hypothetical protein
MFAIKKKSKKIATENGRGCVQRKIVWSAHLESLVRSSSRIGKAVSLGT